MEDTNQTVFIIDTYNKYSSDNIVSVFKVHDREFAIKQTTLEWGKPQLSAIEDQDEYFHIYNTLEEAREYVRTLKKLEASKL